MDKNNSDQVQNLQTRLNQEIVSHKNDVEQKITSILDLLPESKSDLGGFIRVYEYHDKKISVTFGWMQKKIRKTWTWEDFKRICNSCQKVEDTLVIDTSKIEVSGLGKDYGETYYIGGKYDGNDKFSGGLFEEDGSQVGNWVIDRHDKIIQKK